MYFNVIPFAECLSSNGRWMQMTCLYVVRCCKSSIWGVPSQQICGFPWPWRLTQAKNRAQSAQKSIEALKWQSSHREFRGMQMNPHIWWCMLRIHPCLLILEVPVWCHIRIRESKCLAAWGNQPELTISTASGIQCPVLLLTSRKSVQAVSSRNQIQIRLNGLAVRFWFW